MEYCIQKVKTCDRDRFISSLMLPKSFQNEVFPLYSFYIETSKIQGISKESMVRLIRLQWWNDKIQEIYNQPYATQDNPILNELRKIINVNIIPKHLFLNYIEICNKYIEKNQHNSIEEIEEAAQKISIILKITLIIAKHCKYNTDELTKHAGIALYITNILRSEFFHLQQGFTLLPQDLLNESGIEIHNIIDNKYKTMLQEIVKILVERAELYIDTTRSMVKHHTSLTRKILLPITAADSYLKRIRRNKFNIYESTTGQITTNIQLKIIFNSIFGKI